MAIQETPSSFGSFLSLVGIGEKTQQEIKGRIEAAGEQFQEIIQQAREAQRPVDPQKFQDLTAEVKKSNGNLQAFDEKGYLKTEGAQGEIAKAKATTLQKFENDFLNSEPAKSLKPGASAYNHAALDFLLKKTSFSLLPPEAQISLLKEKVFVEEKDRTPSKDQQLGELQASRKDWVFRGSAQRLAQGVKMQAEERRQEALALDAKWETKKAVTSYGYTARLAETAAKLDPENGELGLEAIQAFKVWGDKEHDPANRNKIYAKVELDLKARLAKDPQDWRTHQLLGDVLREKRDPKASSSYANASEALNAKFTEGLQSFRTASLKDPSQAIAILQELENQVRKAQDIPGLRPKSSLELDIGENNKDGELNFESQLGHLKRYKQVLENAKTFVGSMDSETQRKIFSEGYLASLDKKIGHVHEDLKNLRLNLGSALSSPTQKPGLEQLRLSQLAFEVDKEIGDPRYALASLERWGKSLQILPHEAMNSAQQVDALLNLFKAYGSHWDYVDRRPDLKSLVTDKDRERVKKGMRDLTETVLARAEFIETPEAKRAVQNLLLYATDHEDPKVLSYLSADGLKKYGAQH